MLRVCLTFILSMFVFLLAEEVSAQALLITGVSALAGAIIFMFVYIQKLHRNTVDSTKAFTEATMKMISSADNLNDSIKENTNVLHDVHDRILSSTKDR